MPIWTGQLLWQWRRVWHWGLLEVSLCRLIRNKYNIMDKSSFDSSFIMFIVLQTWNWRKWKELETRSESQASSLWHWWVPSQSWQEIYSHSWGSARGKNQINRNYGSAFWSEATTLLPLASFYEIIVCFSRRFVGSGRSVQTMYGWLLRVCIFPLLRANEVKPEE